MRVLSRLGLPLVLALVACNPAEPRIHAGHGKAVAIDAAARRVTLEHDEIPGLMMAMTMAFDVAPEVDLAPLAPGSEVDFRLSEADGALTLIELRPVSPGADTR